MSYRWSAPCEFGAISCLSLVRTASYVAMVRDGTEGCDQTTSGLHLGYKVVAESGDGAEGEKADGGGDATVFRARNVGVE